MFLKSIALLFIASVAATPLSWGLYQTTNVGLRRVDVPGEIVLVPNRGVMIDSYDDSELVSLSRLSVNIPAEPIARVHSMQSIPTGENVLIYDLCHIGF